MQCFFLPPDNGERFLAALVGVWLPRPPPFAYGRRRISPACQQSACWVLRQHGVRHQDGKDGVRAGVTEWWIETSDIRDDGGCYRLCFKRRGNQAEANMSRQGLPQVNPLSERYGVRIASLRIPGVKRFPSIEGDTRASRKRIRRMAGSDTHPPSTSDTPSITASPLPFHRILLCGNCFLSLLLSLIRIFVNVVCMQNYQKAANLGLYCHPPVFVDVELQDLSSGSCTTGTMYNMALQCINSQFSFVDAVCIVYLHIFSVHR